jgi:MFS family permease
MTQLGSMRGHRVEFRGTSALAAVAVLIGVAFGLSTLITPLYVIYQQEFGFSQITLTLIYAAYAIGNIAALLLFGHVSDRAGRRPAALSAVAILIVAASVFLFVNGLAALYIGRILSGLGIGIASGTDNAWVAELVGKADRTRATIVGTSANFLGLGLAALLSGLLADFGPWPLHLSFIVYLFILCAAAALVWLTQETVRDADPRRIEIRPQLSLPREIRVHFIAPAITGFGAMALVGFYAALMPSILSHDLDIKSHTAAGLLLLELATVVAVAIIATHALRSRTSMMWSLALMIPAAAAVAAAQASGSLSVMFVTTTIVAVSAGLGYRGSLQVVNQIAPTEKRAAVVSSYFICCFAGNAVPVIGIGVLSSFTGMTVADIAFSCMIAGFAIVALIFGFAYRG